MPAGYIRALRHEKPAGLEEIQRNSQPAAAAVRGVVRCSALARSAEGDEKPMGGSATGRQRDASLICIPGRMAVGGLMSHASSGTSWDQVKGRTQCRLFVRIVLGVVWVW